MASLFAILLWVAILLGLWWLYFVEYRRLVLDHTRQRLFFIRDHLFLAAERGEVGFDTRAYGLVRLTLNGMIRYAHEISVIQIIGLYRAEKRFGTNERAEQFANDLRVVVSELPWPARKLIMNALRDMHLTMLKHAIYTAPLLALLFVVAQVLLSRYHFWKRGMYRALDSKSNKRRFYALDAEAEQIGAEAAKAAG